MKACYLIMDENASLGLLRDAADGIVATTHFDGNKLYMEKSKEGLLFEFANVKEETKASLLDEWFEDDPIISLLLANPRFNGKSSAFYVTYLRCGPNCTLIEALIRSLVSRQIACMIHNCQNLLISESEFVARITLDPEWQWDII